MDNPLEHVFRGKPAAPKLVVQREVAPSPSNADHNAELAELFADLAEPEHYRPYLTKPRPLLAFALIEKDGTMHGFQYFTVRHPKHQVQNGTDYLSFVADGMAVVIEGRGLAMLFRSLLRHTLAEAREYDGRPLGEDKTHISRLEVVDPRADKEPSAA